MAYTDLTKPLDLAPLKKTVGLSGVTGEAEKPVLFVDHLPGIRGELVAALDRSQTARAAYEAVRETAALALVEDVRQGLLATVKLDGTLYQVDAATGSLSRTPAVTVSNAGVSRGLAFRLAASSHTLLELGTIGFYATATGQVTAVAIDTDTGLAAFTIPDIAAVAGYNVVTLNQRVDLSQGRSLVILFQSATVGFLALADPVPTGIGWLSTQNYQRAVIRSITASGAVMPGAFEARQVVGTTSNTGIVTDTSPRVFVLEASLTCSAEAFVNRYARQLAYAYRHLVASHLMDAKLGSHELAHWVQSNLEFTADKKEEWAKEYKKAIRQRLETLALEGGSICWACSDGGAMTFTQRSLV